MKTKIVLDEWLLLDPLSEDFGYEADVPDEIIERFKKFKNEADALDLIINPLYKEAKRKHEENRNQRHSV